MKKIIPYDDFNGVIPTPENRDIIGTITVQIGNSAVRHGWKIIVYEDEQDDCSDGSRT